MTRPIRPTQALALLSLVLLLAAPARAQAAHGPPRYPELQKTILAQDSALFDAFNTCNTDRFGTFFSDDIEFYHDKGGLTKSRATQVAMMAHRCGQVAAGQSPRIRRDLALESLEVYPINNYGAIEVGIHRFFEVTPGQPDRLVATPQFLHVWQNTNGVWKVTRVVSYDH
jgi:hypothetical protein